METWHEYWNSCDVSTGRTPANPKTRARPPPRNRIGRQSRKWTRFERTRVKNGRHCSGRFVPSQRSTIVDWWYLTRDGVVNARKQSGPDRPEPAGLLRRVRGEFFEMPGLGLTVDQAQRLWGLERNTCEHFTGRVGGCAVPASDRHRNVRNGYTKNLKESSWSCP